MKRRLMPTPMPRTFVFWVAKVRQVHAQELALRVAHPVRDSCVHERVSQIQDYAAQTHRLATRRRCAARVVRSQHCR